MENIIRESDKQLEKYRRMDRKGDSIHVKHQRLKDLHDQVEAQHIKLIDEAEEMREKISTLENNVCSLKDSKKRLQVEKESLQSLVCVIS